MHHVVGLQNESLWSLGSFSENLGFPMGFPNKKPGFPMVFPNKKPGFPHGFPRGQPPQAIASVVSAPTPRSWCWVWVSVGPSQHRWNTENPYREHVKNIRGTWEHMGMGQNLVPLVNIKIAGKWMFIPLKMVLIGIDP